MSVALSGFLAHGSGLDDILWFAVPAALAILVVRRAEKRAAHRPTAGDHVTPDAPNGEPLSSGADE